MSNKRCSDSNLVRDIGSRLELMVDDYRRTLDSFHRDGHHYDHMLDIRKSETGASAK